MMPSTRGSCTGLGALMDLALTVRSPAAVIFSEDEDVVTLGALIAAEMFGRDLPVLRLSADAFAALAAAPEAHIWHSDHSARPVDSSELAHSHRAGSQPCRPLNVGGGKTRGGRTSHAHHLCHGGQSGGLNASKGNRRIRGNGGHAPKMLLNFKHNTCVKKVEHRSFGMHYQL